jgi:hypothetical protein
MNMAGRRAMVVGCPAMWHEFCFRAFEDVLQCRKSPRTSSFDKPQCHKSVLVRHKSFERLDRTLGFEQP